MGLNFQGKPVDKPVTVGWDFIKIILVVCSFFWFGWQVGLFCILLSINIDA